MEFFETSLYFSDVATPWHWRDLSVRINWCGSVRCEREWSWRSVLFPDFDLWFVWAGHGRIGTAGRRREVGPGSVLCLKPGLRYEADHDPEQQLGVCYVHFDFVTPAGGAVRPTGAGGPPAAAVLDDVDLHERVLKHAIALHEAARPGGSPVACAYVCATLHAMAAAPRRATASSPGDDGIRDAARAVRENPSASFSVEAMAEQAGYSPDHFARRFRAVVGMTPKAFCVRARIDRAKVLLDESPMSVGGIAAALGYADVYFFSRQFKQETGMPPSAWRDRDRDRDRGP